jgi:PAS domain S-box-containing protein
MKSLSVLLSKKWNLKITSQLATLTIPLMGAISFFIFMYFPAEAERHEMRAIEEKARHITSMAAYSVASPLFFENAKNLDEALKTIKKGGDIAYLMVVKEGGVVAAHFNPDRALRSNYLYANDHNRVSNDGEVYKTMTPVVHYGQEIGRLYIGFPLTAQREEVARTKRSVALISLSIFIFGMVVIFSISKVVIKPLKNMVGTVEQIARGDLTKRAAVMSEDEVGHLARSFNVMVDNLQAAYRALENINKSLEERVANRTQALRLEISERQLADVALRESEEKYRTLFEELIDVVIISTPDGKLLDINSAGIRLLGYTSKEEVLQIDLTHDLFVDREQYQQYMGTIEAQGLVNAFELSLKRKDGQKVTVSASANGIRNEKGDIVAYRNIMRDITNVKRLEHQLLESQRMETVGRLAGGIAHDFNNMLNIILGNAQLAKMVLGEDGAAAGYISSIESAVQRAAGFVRQLLAFSRRQLLDLSVVHFNDVVTDFAKMIHRFIGENIEMKIISARRLPTAKVDVAQMNQVLLNLVINARDSMPDGGELTIETYTRDLDKAHCRVNMDSKPGNYVVLSVTDTGTGMNEETLKKIFEPFFTTKGVGEGTGLGLAVVYGIVKQHGGFIDVYSELGKGTTVKIYIPSVREAADCPAATKEPVKGGNEVILVAEDEPSLREVASAILASLGYKTLVASNGEEALEIFREKNREIDLVLLDVVMPKLSGKEAYEEMKKIDPSVRSVFVTGYSLSGIHSNFILEQGIDAIQKPYSSEVLGRKMREVLDRVLAA